MKERLDDYELKAPLEVWGNSDAMLKQVQRASAGSLVFFAGLFSLRPLRLKIANELAAINYLFQVIQQKIK